MAEHLIIIALGVLITALGIGNCLGHIDTIHRYNRSRITEQTRRPYGRVVGIGTMIIGASAALCSALVWITGQSLIYLGLFLGLLVGLGFILYAQFKYNRGVF